MSHRSSPDSRRSVFIKHTNFTRRHGLKHHGFDKEKAPYPNCYERSAVDLDVIDHIFLKEVKKSVSFVDFKKNNQPTPTICLDLGCGTGTWILDALKEWPECQFVGFDLVNMQPPSDILGPMDSLRVEWVHGNFLTTKLPFEDGQFDHVHIRSIARAVPENKWGYLFEEISRVLRPGGSVEMIEDDIQFPSLPQWYTNALRARDGRQSSRKSSTASSRRSLPISPPPTPPHGEGPHDHMLIESLFYSLFETRFINREPTSILPSYFATYFRHVLCSPAINFPTPAFPFIPTYSIATSRRFSKSSRQLSATPMPRPRRRRGSNSIPISSDSDAEADGEEDGEELTQQYTPPSSGDESTNSSTSVLPALPYYSPHYTTCSSAELDLLPLSSFTESSGFSYALQLFRMCNLVLSCRESMWEVLTDRIRNREAELKELGWDDEDLESDHSRQRFDRLMARYQSDMQTRAALWERMALSKSPEFKLPVHLGSMTRAELNDEEIIHRAVLEAQKLAPREELRKPCRTLRIFIGYNPSLVDA